MAWLAAALATTVRPALRRALVIHSAGLSRARRVGRTAPLTWFPIVGLGSAAIVARSALTLPCTAGLLLRRLPILGLLILGSPGGGLLRANALPAAFDAPAPAIGVLLISIPLLLGRTLLAGLIAVGRWGILRAARTGLPGSPARGRLTGEASRRAASGRRIGFQ